MHQSCIDVCSHYLLLRPPKDTAVVSEQLLSDFGTPSVIQSDRGSEGSRKGG